MKTEALRTYWHSVAVATAVRHAHLLELLSTESDRLTDLPPEIYREVVKTIAAERDRAYTTELEKGTRPPRIEQDLNTNLWNFMRGFSRNHSLFGR